MHNIKIAVIGKSSAGKSAFIRLFSSTPDHINSVGKGQTTRAYAEYLFLKEYDSEYPSVEAKIATQTEFSENRVTQVLDKFKKGINDQRKHNVAWIKEQLKNDTYNARIKNIMLFSDDFFNINEFSFIDDDIVKKADVEYDKFQKELLDLENEPDDSDLINESETTENGLDKSLTNFYKQIYEIIINSIEERYKDNQAYVKENNISFFKFYVNDETRNMFSLLLKVDDKTQYSFTGIITNVRVSSKLNPKYKSCLKKLGFDNITLIDTYGLDHSESITDDVLTERYNKIFNKDYPDVSTVFLVEALHTGASNDFKNAITTLYEVKPEIMTYIIGTHIDEDENEKELMDKLDWLFSEDKTKYPAPKLNGKVLQILNNKIELKATLLDNGITETMAEKRCEVMRKRFAPFCGDMKKNSSKINYEEVNIKSIQTLFSSILDREHLGDGYIEIDKIINGISTSEILEQFAVAFINNATKRFKQIHDISAPRTRWKIRENLEHYTLGFDGTTLDATWVRILRDAFNQTFTKQIVTSTGKMMLSDALKMEGHSKIAFDETVTEIYPYIFRRKCLSENKFNSYSSQISCIECAEIKDKNDCIWNLFITAAKYERFQERSNYYRVIDWLNALHSFSPENNSLTNDIAGKFKLVIKEELVRLCRARNVYIASKKIAQSIDSYTDAKKETYTSYKKGFDSNIEEEDFYNEINKCLSHNKIIFT